MDYIEQRNEIAVQARGRILQAAALFEKMADVFLSMYYSQKGKQKPFMLIFLSKMELSKKVEALIETIGLYPNKLKDEHPNYESEIRKIVTVRNVMAHEVLEPIGEEFDPEGVLQFDNYKKNRKISRYSTEDVNFAVANIEKYSTAVLQLVAT